MRIKEDTGRGQQNTSKEKRKYTNNFMCKEHEAREINKQCFEEL